MIATIFAVCALVLSIDLYGAVALWRGYERHWVDDQEVPR